MSGFHIDFSDLDNIRESAGATRSQMIAAFNRALKRTTAKLQRESVALMIGETAVKGKSRVNKRVRSFTERAAGTDKNPGTGKVWFGLNDMNVSDLKGGMRNPRGIKPKNRKRDEKGRFISERGSRGATFTPRGQGLHPTTFLNSFVGTVRGKKSIWIRSSSGHVNEAMLPIYHPMISSIEGDLFSDAGEMLMQYYEQDLRGRVAGGVK
ncbi:hypothetical protein QB794_002244 [Salmonella enterica]|nr:hypothetical protein [Salmonella enterica]EKS4862816.1 hypothetical protein [Salmonella enterica]EKS4880529.1 hypothetical protein [Salmonella enterica]EKS4884988.1 hypothetical protein [Salmonella enterica]EKS5974644.1 hypothetical protein [Salmonella enterica]